MTRSELLSAYLDGALDEAQQEAFERNLADDPALADELARLLQNDRNLRSAIGAVAGDDSAEALAVRYGVVEGGQIEMAAAANDNHRWRWVAGLTIAAAAGALFFLAPGGITPRAGDEPTFDAALDRTPSLRQTRLADGRTLVPKLTVRTASGTYCREFLLSAGRAAQLGLACRQGENWKMIVAVPSAPASGIGDIALAGDTSSPALEAAYARLKVSDPLGAPEERALIARRWGAEKTTTHPE